LPLTPGTGGNTSRSFAYNLVSIKDGNGCDAVTMSGTRNLTVFKKPVANAGPPFSSTCGPTFDLLASVSVAGAIPGGSWTFPGGVTSTDPPGAGMKVTIDPATAPPQITKRFIWHEINWDITCSDKDSIDVTFYKQIPKPNIGADKNPLYLFDNVDSLHAPKPPFGTGEWLPPTGGTIIKNPNDTITSVSGLFGSPNGISYEFIWKVTNGACTTGDTILYKVFDLIVPKGFSPDNNDSYNDVFSIRGLDTLYSEIVLRILNSAGSEVFSIDYLPGDRWVEWNGKNEKGEDYPEGTYYYVLTIKSTRNDKIFKKSGFILLKRYNLH
jgi:gliding motility-associated-like protein